MDNLLNPANVHQQRCPRCQSPLNTVVVHGHEQCVICKSNIFECCSGDTCETDHNLAAGCKRGKPMKVIDYYLDAKVIFIGILVRIFGQSISLAIAISPTHLRLTLSP